MKVAVISEQPQVGRSSFSILLGTVFSRTQMKKSVIFPTNPADELFMLAEPKDVKTSAKSVSVYQAMIGTAAVEDKHLYDYAYRIGEEETYIFDIYGSTMRRSDLNELFHKTLKRVDAELTIIDVSADVKDEETLEILRNVDVILYCFTTNEKSYKAVREYITTVEPNITRRTGYVCLKHDKQAVSDKQVSKEIGIKLREIMFIPYNSVVIKEGLNHNLHSLAKFIAGGHTEVLNLRIRLLEVMQFLFDSGRFKYIKGVNEWHK